MIVLDASALLASLLDEPGGEEVDAVLADAVMSTVNLAEAISTLSKKGIDETGIRDIIDAIPLEYVEPSVETAIKAGLMRPVTDRAGLSLGDRMCLALAIERNAEALTTDRAWAKVADAIGVTVRLIR